MQEQDFDQQKLDNECASQNTAIYATQYSGLIYRKVLQQTQSTHATQRCKTIAVFYFII